MPLLYITRKEHFNAAHQLWNLNWSDDNFHRLSVQFAYQKYDVVYEGSYDLVAAATEYFGAKGARLFDKAGQNVNNSIGNVFNRIF